MEGVRVAFMNNTNQHFNDVEERKKATTIREKNPHFLDCILELCDVENEEDLPAIWNQMVNLKRGSKPRITLFQTEASKEATHFRQIPMCVSVPQELSLKNFKLG